MSSSASTHYRTAWLMTITAGLLFFYEFIQLNSMNSLNKSLISTFHFSNQQLGMISGAYFIANASLVFIAGNILDRNSARRATLCAMLLCTIGTLGFALANSFWELTIARFIIGVGGAFCFLSGLKIATRWFPISKIGAATGILVTMAMLGGMVAQSPLQILISNFGWRNALLIDTTLGVLIFILMFLVLRDSPEQKVLHPRHVDTLHPILPSIKLALRNYKNYLTAIYTCCLNFPIFILGAIWGISYLSQAENLNQVMAAHICLMLFIGSIVGCPVIGFLVDKFSQHRIFMLGGGIICLALFAILIANITYNPLAIMAIFFLLGFFSSAQIISYSYINIDNCKSISASATSIVSTVLLLGGAIMQPFFGKILDFARKQHIAIQHAYTYAMLLLPASIIIALICAFALPKQPKEQQS